MAEEQIKNELPLAVLERMIRKSGLRSSISGIKELKDVLFKVAIILIEDAKEVALHAKRQSIKGRDIEYAYNQLKKGQMFR